MAKKKQHAVKQNVIAQDREKVQKQLIQRIVAVNKNVSLLRGNIYKELYDRDKEQELKNLINERDYFQDQTLMLDQENKGSLKSP